MSFFSENSSNKDQILLCQFCFGHPPFRILRVIFPSLFQNVDENNFHCDVSEFAKHQHVSFPLSNKKSSFSFKLIYSDIWGPSLL